MQDQSLLIRTAVASLFAAGLLAGAANAAEPAKEKCFGVAKAGQNDCGIKFSKHSCAGESKVDNDPNDFKLVPKGSCVTMGGKLRPEGADQAK